MIKNSNDISIGDNDIDDHMDNDNNRNSDITLEHNDNDVDNDNNYDNGYETMVSDTRINNDEDNNDRNSNVMLMILMIRMKIDSHLIIRNTP